MDEQTIRKLEEIRNIFINEKMFPKGYCALVSREVEKQLGFETVQGEFFIDESQKPNGFRWVHVWNKGLDGEIIDLTVRQFDDYLPNVYITKKDLRYKASD